MFILAIFLVLAGLASYFFAESTTYDSNANYELSRVHDGKWQRHVISGADLNEQAKAANPKNQLMSLIIMGGGLALLGTQWWLSRR